MHKQLTKTTKTIVTNKTTENNRTEQLLQQLVKSIETINERLDTELGKKTAEVPEQRKTKRKK